MLDLISIQKILLNQNEIQFYTYFKYFENSNT